MTYLLRVWESFYFAFTSFIMYLKGWRVDNWFQVNEKTGIHSVSIDHSDKWCCADTEGPLYQEGWRITIIGKGTYGTLYKSIWEAEKEAIAKLNKGKKTDV